MNQVLDNFEIWVCNLFFNFVNWCNKIAFDYFEIVNVLLIVVGIIIFTNIAITIFKNKSKKINFFKTDKIIILKNNLVVDTLKIAIIIIATLTISSFINFYEFKVISIFFNQYLLITILAISSYYILKLNPLKKSTNKFYISKIGYLEIIHNYIVFLIFFSSIFGVKYIVVNIIGIYIVTGTIYYLKIKSEYNINENKKSILYKTRKGQLIDFHNILSKKIDDNYAVALNGEWGTGKTVFLKEYMKNYKDENLYIYIKPMITDSIVSLIGQISSQLTNVMIENGFNIGGKKLIEKYFNEVLKIVGEKSKFSFKDLFEFNDYKDTYVDLKKKIQNNIDELKETIGKKIIFVVDDFDRINENNQETILDFIKEIVDFKNTITVFAFDYKKVNENDKINHEYLEKFVSDEIYLAKILYKDILDEYLKKKIFTNLKEDSVVYKIAVEVEEIVYGEYLRLNKVEHEIRNEFEFLKNIPDDVEESDYKNIRKNENECWLKLMSRLDNSRRVISFIDNINGTLHILERKKDYYKLNEEVINELGLSNLIYTMNFIKVFDNDTFIEIVRHESIENYLKILNSKRNKNTYRNLIRSMNNEKVIKIYDEESISAEVKKWYIEKIIYNKLDLSLYSQRSEVIRREKLKIFKDLFIDYNLENSGIDFESENKKLVKKIDELKSDTNTFIFEDNSNIDEQIDEYIRAILDNYEEEKTKERIEKFAEYCIKLVNTKKLEFSSYVMTISNRRHYGVNEYIVIFIEAILKYLDNEYEMSKADKNNIRQYIEESAEYIANKYFSIFGFYLEIITDGKLKYTIINEQLFKFTDCNQLLSMINSLLETNEMKTAENYKELYKYFNKKVLEINKKKINLICIDELNAKFKEFLYQKDKIEEVFNLLEPKIKVDYSKIDIKKMEFDEIIEFIQAIKEKIGEDKLTEFTKEYWDNFSRSIYYIREYWNNEMSKIERENAKEIVDTCIFLFNYIKENKIYDDMRIIDLSLNIQWMIDNYKKEESY